MTDVQPSIDTGSDPEHTPESPPMNASPAVVEAGSSTHDAETPPAPQTPETPETPETPVTPPMAETETGTIRSFRVMHVEDVSVDLPSQYPAVTLVEVESPIRTLVFPVGLPEGAAMAQALRRMASPRPMTHELFMDVLQKARIDVVSVRLIGHEEGNLLAELDLMTPTGAETLDCRPSDGLVLALRMPVPAPILVDERLLESSGDVEPHERRS